MPGKKIFLCVAVLILTILIVTGCSPKTDVAPIENATRSKHFEVESNIVSAGTNFVVKWHDMPGKGTGSDWITLVPKGTPSDTWGYWIYTDTSSGKFEIIGDVISEPGEYEMRAYYDYPSGEYEIQDRLQIIVKAVDEDDATESAVEKDPEADGESIPWEGGTYTGEIKDGKPHGQGVFTHPNGSSYDGGWKEGILHGYGTLVLPDGKVYVGEIKDGTNHGQGKWTYPDGSTYEGEWVEGLLHGQGTVVFADGRVYVGEWEEGLAHGQGTMTYLDGGEYVGEWKNDKANGQGTMTWANGQKYVGEWKNNLPHGQGIMTHPDGSIQEGEWVNGEFSG